MVMCSPAKACHLGKQTSPADAAGRITSKVAIALQNLCSFSGIDTQPYRHGANEYKNSNEVSVVLQFFFFF